MNLTALKPATTPITYLAVDQEIEIFSMAWRCQLPVMIKGPTGCGKSRFVEHMAEQLGRPLFTISCHDDLSANDLIGRHLISNTGTYWVDGPLTRAVREGGICYLDEVVEARKDTTVILHALSDHRRMLNIERTGESLLAPPEFMLVISYNPGYQHLLKGLKPSTRQRFIAMSFDFPDAALEQKIIESETGLASIHAKTLVTFARALRQTAQHDLEEVPGTRLLIDAARLILQGCRPLLACRFAIIECLSDEAETIQALMQVARAIMGD